MAGRRLTPSALRTQIAGGALDPIYVILGRDQTEAASLLADFASVIEEDVRPFNVERLYGGDAATTVAGIVDSARTLPWLSPQRIIIVLQADRLLAPKRESEAAARDLELLEKYIRAPQSHAVLVLVAGSVDGRRREVEAADEGGDGCRVRRRGRRARSCRVDSEVRRRGRGANRRGGRAAARRTVGPRYRPPEGGPRPGDAVRGGDRPVTSVDVEEVAGDPTLRDPWAIKQAIVTGSTPQALGELNLLLAASTPPLQVLGQLRWIVSEE